MKPLKALLLAIVALVTVFSTSPILESKSVQPKILDSVRGLQWDTMDHYISEEGAWTISVTRTTHCTVGYINKLKHYWLTAYHCVSDEYGQPQTFPMYIDDHPVRVVFGDEQNDVAVLETLDYGVTPLKLSKKAPEFLDQLTVAGYPFGIGPVLTVGRVSQPLLSIDWDGKTYEYMVYNVHGCAGNSGSPVVDADGKVVSVLQVGWGDSSCSAMMGGVPYAKLVSIVGKYFGR